MISGHPPSRADDEVYLGAAAGAEAGTKVELTVPPPTYSNDGQRQCREQVAPSSDWSSERGDSGIIGSGGGGAGELCGSLVVVPGCLGTFDDAAVGEVLENSNVKLELLVSSPPRTSGT